MKNNSCKIPTIDGPRGSRSDRVGMIRPMGEAWVPRLIRWPELVGGNIALKRNRAIDLADLVLWLDVEKSKRWKPNERGGTYCDHYAADFWSQWLGRGKPTTPPLSSWLWWRDDCNGPAVYGDTVVEHGATSTYDWLAKNAEAFGWQRMPNEQSAERWCNENTLPGLVIARKVGGGASHVAVVLPDIVGRAIRSRATLTPLSVVGSGPLTTEAGGRNRILTRRRWWVNSEGVQWLVLPKSQYP